MQKRSYTSPFPLLCLKLRVRIECSGVSVSDTLTTTMSSAARYASSAGFGSQLYGESL